MLNVSFYTLRGNGFKFDLHPISCMLEMKETQIRHIFLKMNTKILKLPKTKRKPYGKPNRRMHKTNEVHNQTYKQNA